MLRLGFLELPRWRHVAVMCLPTQHRIVQQSWLDFLARSVTLFVPQSSLFASSLTSSLFSTFSLRISKNRVEEYPFDIVHHLWYKVILSSCGCIQYPRELAIDALLHRLLNLSVHLACCPPCFLVLNLQAAIFVTFVWNLVHLLVVVHILRNRYMNNAINQNDVGYLMVIFIPLYILLPAFI